MRRTKIRWLTLGVGVAALTGALYPLGASAQDPSQPESVAPAGILTVDAAKLFDPATAPQLEGPAAPAGVTINRPTIPFGEYRALKQAAAKAPQGDRGADAGRAKAAIAVTAGGSGQSRGAPGAAYFPPDGGGSTGTTQTGQALNSKLAFYTKANPPVLQCANSFATLTGYSAQGLFDPRLVYDAQYNRWVYSVEAFPESSTVQRQFLAISTTSNGCGTWLVYNFDMNFVNLASFFWDFPGTGMSQDAIIFTGNRFNGNSFGGSIAFAIAKALVYNGLGFSVPIFGSLGGTLTPPYVLDQNPNAFMLQVLSSSALGRRTFVDPANGAYSSISAATSIPSGFTIAAPRNAVQPGCSSVSPCSLDTSDTRFSSSSTQYGTHLWNAHTISAGGFPTNRFYDVRTDAAGLNQAGNFFTSASSDDFNVSLAARTNGTVYFGWNSTGAATRVTHMVTGRKAADAVGTVSAKVNTFTSPVVLTGNFDANFGCQRWGDYAAASLDPSSTTAGWAMNETVASSTLWGTHFARFTVT